VYRIYKSVCNYKLICNEFSVPPTIPGLKKELIEEKQKRVRNFETLSFESNLSSD
jgi:hypothetical protein